MTKAPTKTIAIIGGGPTGLMAAQTLGELGYDVTIYDAMPSVGRKFLLAGRGGLNLTHSEDIAAFTPRYGDAAPWMKAIIAGFTPTNLQAWAGDLGQEVFIGSSGRVFPKAMKASPLLRAWLGRLVQLGVKFETGARWQGWNGANDLVFVRGDASSFDVNPDATLLALGGASWARLGSNGAWVEMLAAKGIEITPLVASNCGVLVDWSLHVADRFAGLPIKAVCVACGDTSARGDLMITRTGLEGGAVYALSPAIREALAGENPSLTIDLRPDQDVVTLANKLVKAKAGQSISSALKGHANLSPPSIGLMREATANQLPQTAMGLARLIKSIPIKLAGLAPLDRAISTAGGIGRAALTKDLMLKKLPGIFAAGEMLDWDAPTGGYLLQACLASGRHAARGIDAYLQSTPTE
jgi:uncharacterized flavoprotein (TIGR03862 family)